ncbi:MAG: glucosaminidase domain-containing protein [Bacteroidales bacterium]|nr:glucosaminidase domain-containing protein [Bacteroidales bacterium]
MESYCKIIGRKVIIGFITLLLPFCSYANGSTPESSHKLGQPSRELTRKEYIEKYKHIAVQQMDRYGIPASIIMAQACLESGNGNSRLAVKANNHFGIKCHNWSGKRIYHNDDQRGECFRKYNSAEDSFIDHSEFLRNGMRYQSLFDLKLTDYKAWAHGLKAAGYATNPQYAQMLIEIIEKNGLYELDSKGNHHKAEKRVKKAKREQTGRETAVIEANPLYQYTIDRPIYKNNGVQYIIANGTETYNSIAKEYNLFTKELLKFNDLHKGNNLYKGKDLSNSKAQKSNSFATEERILSGTIIYLEPKKRRCTQSAYVVQPDESIYMISQKLGIKLKELYKLNSMKYGSEVEAGKILNLQK